MAKKKIWIKDLDAMIKQAPKEYRDYIIWVDKLQRFLYRVLKTYPDTMKKVGFFALGKNAKLFDEVLGESCSTHRHIQQMWIIIEKMNDIASRNEPEAKEFVKLLFAITMICAKENTYEIRKRND